MCSPLFARGGSSPHWSCRLGSDSCYISASSFSTPCFPDGVRSVCPVFPLFFHGVRCRFAVASFQDYQDGYLRRLVIICRLLNVKVRWNEGYAGLMECQMGFEIRNIQCGELGKKVCQVFVCCWFYLTSKRWIIGGFLKCTVLIQTENEFQQK